MYSIGFHLHLQLPLHHFSVIVSLRTWLSQTMGDHELVGIPCDFVGFMDALKRLRKVEDLIVVRMNKVRDEAPCEFVQEACEMPTWNQPPWHTFLGPGVPSHHTQSLPLSGCICGLLEWSHWISMHRLTRSWTSAASPVMP